VTKFKVEFIILFYFCIFFCQKFLAEHSFDLLIFELTIQSPLKFSNDKKPMGGRQQQKEIPFMIFQ